VLALTSVASLMVGPDTQVVATALPAIRVHLHASLASLEWTVNAYTLTFAVLLLTGGVFGPAMGTCAALACWAPPSAWLYPDVSNRPGGSASSGSTGAIAPRATCAPGSSRTSEFSRIADSRPGNRASTACRSQNCQYRALAHNKEAKYDLSLLLAVP
jgi:MFS family permease